MEVALVLRAVCLFRGGGRWEDVHRPVDAEDLVNEEVSGLEDELHADLTPNLHSNLADSSRVSAIAQMGLRTDVDVARSMASYTAAPDRYAARRRACLGVAPALSTISHAHLRPSSRDTV